MKIKEKRKECGLSQAELSKLLGIPKRSIENWERGASKPPTYVEYLICYWLEKEILKR